MSFRKLKLLKVTELQKGPKNKIIRYCATVTSTALLDVQPFESIPGPPGNGLPFIGHSNLFGKKPAGKLYKLEDRHRGLVCYVNMISIP